MPGAGRARPLTDDERQTYRGLRAEALKRRIDNDFAYHAPKTGQTERYEAIREGARLLAHTIIHMAPESREQSSALTHLEEAVFFANAAIARNE